MEQINDFIAFTLAKYREEVDNELVADGSDKYYKLAGILYDSMAYYLNEDAEEEDQECIDGAISGSSIYSLDLGEFQSTKPKAKGRYIIITPHDTDAGGIVAQYSGSINKDMKVRLQRGDIAVLDSKLKLFFRP